MCSSHDGEKSGRKRDMRIVKMERDGGGDTD
jgi:hypothetical protein